MPCTIEGKNQFGKLFSIQDFQNKILILDFWHTRCGVCFRKFPIVQELYTKYKSDTSILILTINKPIEDDSTGQAFNVIKQNGYTFPVLLPKNKSLPEIFEVTSYPTTFVIDKNGKIIFKGDIELVEPILHDLKNL